MKIMEPGQKRKRLTLLVFILCLAISMGGLSGCSRTQSSTGANTGETPEYAEKVFGVDIISLEIIADEAAWQAMH